MTDHATPPDRNLLGPFTLVIACVVLVAAGVVAVMLWREVGRDRRPAPRSGAFVFDVERYKVIPAEKIGYREDLCFETGLERVTALAVGPGGDIVVGGDEAIRGFSPVGAQLLAISVHATPHALAVAADDTLYAALANRVLRGPLTGALGSFATLPGDKARITAIAVDARGVYVADAGSRCVYRFDLDGELRGKIGLRDRARNIPGFSVPSPYFDVRAAGDGLLRVVDPGRHHVDAFTVDGDLEFSWGKPSFALEGFSGCCNPAHIAMFPDGRFVTSEKGIPRVKVYDAGGRFLTAVVGSAGLDTETEPCDVAVDRRGRVLVLDPGSSVIRVFVPLRSEERDD